MTWGRGLVGGGREAALWYYMVLQKLIVTPIAAQYALSAGALRRTCTYQYMYSGAVGRRECV